MESLNLPWTVMLLKVDLNDVVRWAVPSVLVSTMLPRCCDFIRGNASKRHLENQDALRPTTFAGVIAGLLHSTSLLSQSARACSIYLKLSGSQRRRVRRLAIGVTAFHYRSRGSRHDTQDQVSSIRKRRNTSFIRARTCVEHLACTN